VKFREVLKSELYSLVPLEIQQSWAEFVGILRTGGCIGKKNGFMTLSLQHRDLALIKKCVGFKKKFFPHTAHIIVEERKKGLNAGILYDLDIYLEEETIFTELGFGSIEPLLAILQSANDSFFVRGVFEVRGYVSEPQRGYHLDITLPSEQLTQLLLSHLGERGMSFKYRYFREEFHLYSKNASTIETFLGYLGAIQSYLLLEKIRVEKATVESLTKWVNCATSNLERTVESSLRQRQKLSRVNLELLPPRLRQIAYLRLQYPYASLRELGEKCVPPLSKMNVFRRLKELENFESK